MERTPSAYGRAAPHGPQGWYSTGDADVSTMSIIAEHAGAMSGLRCETGQIVAR